MCSKTWMKWLSAIALFIMVVGESFDISYSIRQDGSVDMMGVAVLLLAITAVISAFSKDKKK